MAIWLSITRWWSGRGKLRIGLKDFEHRMGSVAAGEESLLQYVFECGECDFVVRGPELGVIRREFYFHTEFAHLGRFRREVQERAKSKIYAWVNQRSAI